MICEPFVILRSNNQLGMVKKRDEWVLMTIAHTSRNFVRVGPYFMDTPSKAAMLPTWMRK